MNDKMMDLLGKSIVHDVYLIAEKIMSIIPDKAYLKMIYRLRMGKKLNVENPVTMNEKLQWMKLYYHNPECSKIVDKYDGKQYAKSIIDDKYVIDSLGVYDSYDEIDFDKLPDQFVLKCTHDSGSIYVCTDKSKINHKELKKKFTKSLKRNYYLGNREWAYKNASRRIIAEPYIDSLGKPNSIEYKVTCFNGKVAFITICQGKAHDKLCLRKNDFFTKDFEFIPVENYYRNSEKPLERQKPVFWDELIELSEKLTEGFPHLRADWYVVDDQLIFGELTFYTWGGYIRWDPEEWDKKFGDMMELPEKWD